MRSAKLRLRKELGCFIMLTEIQCEKFIENGKKRSPIKFHRGLNVVLGNSSGSNAIGKSTFLLIIDFVFGGDDYVKMAKDTMSHIGHHNINFVFDFDGRSMFFSRSTNTPQTVYRCDSQYRPIQQISVKEFCQVLFDEYWMNLQFLSFSDVVERFFRIYGRSNHNERRPLFAPGRESEESAVESLMKLFGEYEAIAQLKTTEELYDIKLFGRRKKLPFVIDLSRLEQNNKAIDAMRKRLQALNKANEEADLRALGIDSETAEMLARVQKELKMLNRRKGRLLSQLSAVESNTPDSEAKPVKNFDALLQFFPNADVKAFEEIEHFHNKIAEIMTVEIQEEIDKLKPLIQGLDAEIASHEKKIEESGIVRSMSQSILTQYAKITREIERLENENEELHRQQELQAQWEKAERLIASLQKKQEEALTKVERTINDKMAEINGIATDYKKTSPILRLTPQKTFEFETPEDISEGTSFKSLVVYDLSILSLTPLPALIHDSSIVKRIEDLDFERILGLYQGSGKQVFIAFDKADSCTPEAYKILKENAVLRLSEGGNELFGTSWSRRNPNE